MVVPYLYLSLEGDRPWAGGLRTCLAQVDQVCIGRGEGRSVQRSKLNGRTVLRIDVADDRMSREHIIMERISGDWTVRDLDSSNGSFVGGERVERAAMVDGTVIGLGRTVFVFREHCIDDTVAQSDCDFSDLADTSPGLRTLNPMLALDLRRALQFASTDVDILVLGDTGTGKELIARAVHEASGRSGDFVAVNCGALTNTLVESQLFGHQKGAFSGADESRPGLIRSADKGTLFLDEIGDLPLASQAAFLRVLQEREVTPVGGTRPITFDAKLIAATHCDLDEMVVQQEFRADLLARIRGFVLRLPALSERLEDLGGIIAGLLTAGDRVQKTRISLPAGLALIQHGWPQNIRELVRTLEVSTVLVGDGEMRRQHLPEHMRAALRRATSQTDTDADALNRAATDSDESEGSSAGRREQLIALLRLHEGNISAVARDMGKARNQIQRWIKRYDLDVSSYRR